MAKLTDEQFISKYRCADELKPCPFCGNTEGLYFGANDSTSSCVSCPCGAKIVDSHPFTEYSKSEIKELNRIEKAFEVNITTAMFMFHTLRAINKWNRRI